MAALQFQRLTFLFWSCLFGGSFRLPAKSFPLLSNWRCMKTRGTLTANAVIWLVQTPIKVAKKQRLLQKAMTWKGPERAKRTVLMNSNHSSCFRQRKYVLVRGFEGNGRQEAITLINYQRPTTWAAIIHYAIYCWNEDDSYAALLFGKVTKPACEASSGKLLHLCAKITRCQPNRLSFQMITDFSHTLPLTHPKSLSLNS